MQSSQQKDCIMSHSLALGGPTPLTAPEIIDKMKTVAAIKTDKQLGEMLNVSKVTIASWRKRNSVPMEKCVLFSQKTLCSIDEVVFGSGGIHTLGGVESPFAYGIVIYFYERFRDDFLFGDKWNTCLWWAKKIPHLIEYYDWQIGEISTIDNLNEEEAASKLRAAIDEFDPGDIMNLLEQRFQGFGLFGMSAATARRRRTKKDDPRSGE